VWQHERLWSLRAHYVMWSGVSCVRGDAAKMAAVREIL